MKFRLLMFVCGFLPLLLLGCDTSHQTEEKKPDSAAATSKLTLSQEVAQLFIGVTSEARNRPNIDALDNLAAAYNWPKAPDNMNGMLNAQKIYLGKVDGQRVLLGSDGTNDVLSISMQDQFAPQEMLGELRQVYTLKPRASDTTDGQKIEIFLMSDGGKTVGLLTLNYGVVKAIQGTGTISYASIARVRKEIPDIDRSDN